jgi:protein O-GlcNAc transferase
LATTLADNEVFQRALAALQSGNVKDAERLFKAILRTQPRHVAALNLLGIVLTRLGRFAEAETYLRQALQEHAGSDATLCNYGIVLKALNRPVEALKSFTQALAINPKVAETWISRGVAFNDLNRFDEAIEDFGRAIQLNPSHAEAYFNTGKSLAALRRPDQAVAAFDKALALKPDLAEGWIACGNAYCELRRYDEGLAAYDRALALQPKWAAAYCNRGAALLDMERYAEALASSDQAILLAPDLALAHSNRGGALVGLKQYAQALESCDRAISLDRSRPDGWLVRGNVFTGLKQYDDAFAAYDRALALRPDLAEAWLGRARVLTELKRYDDALAAYDKAIALKPQLAEAWLGRGNIFADLKRYQDAFAAYDRALALKPDLNEAAGARLLSKLHTCTWTNLSAEVAQLLSAVRAGKLASPPFGMLAIASSAADQLQCAKRHAQDQPVFPAIWRGEVYPHDRIRVAYLSSDFHEHPVAHLTVGLFETHDKSRFEVTGLSFGRDDNSAMRQRVKNAFEHFYDVRHKSDQEIAELIRDLEIDIAVDLNGFTGDNRRNAVARRAAPIQVNYLGYSGTMGADYVDYILADATLIPQDQCAFYTEHVVWLPETYQVNDGLRHISERTPSRQDCNLPEAGFVFCCFNATYKIAPEMFDIWMRLLNAVDGSVLWLKDNGAVASQNLRLEAERRGVARERLVFAPLAPLMADHLARHRQADLFLDTLPYNAHTTTSDALGAGLPVLTCLGATFAGRVATSLLKAAGVEELIAGSLEEYEALALKLARDPSLLASLKAKLAQNRTSCALFDTKRATRNFESAYRMMWERYQSGDMRRPSGEGSTPIRIA